MDIRQRLRQSDGAVMVIMGVGLVLLMAVAALVVDLAAVYVNRSVSRTVTDNAAAAGALDLASGNGRDGCSAAIDYLELNLETSAPFSGVNCNPFPTRCDAATEVRVTTGTVDQWTVRVTYPVPDGHPMLDPDAIGAGSQAVVAEDGAQCDRIAVQLESQHSSFFARVIGNDTIDTEVHTVALASIPIEGQVPLNLLILERYDCDALVAAGSGGGDGGITVDAVINPNTGELEPGFIALDSDGSGAGCGSDGAIDIDGSNSEIRADGLDGCAGQLGSHNLPGGYTVGEGCGQIKVFATGTPGCNFPACTSSGVIAPEPTKLPSRKTRAQVDYRYNCKASYPFPAGWEIPPCPDPPAPHIDNLITEYGTAGTTPAGFTTWTSLGHPCTVEGPVGTTITASGDIRIDCPLFDVKRNVIFEGGDVIFDGDVAVTSSGVLAVNSDSSTAFPHGEVDDQAIAYFRGGSLSKAGSASVLLNRTTVYIAPGGGLSMAGGSGTLVWTAPTVGDFQALALWSDATATHQLAGQSELDLEGVFFVPDATVTYAGDGIQRSVEAQFIVRKLAVSGNGKLVVAPAFDQSVLFPIKVAQLIR
jgi:hypothetical protein